MHSGGFYGTSPRLGSWTLQASPFSLLSPHVTSSVMDNPPDSKELPPAPSAFENRNLPELGHARTVPAETRAMEGSGPSNGRSSIDSYAERPKSQAGAGPSDTAKAGSSGFSKMLKRRNKKKNQKAEEQPVGGERDLPGSRDGSVSTNPAMPEQEAANLLVDDSRPNRLVFFFFLKLHTGEYL